MIDEKYTWDFGLLYKSNEEVQRDIDEVKRSVLKIVGFQGKLNTKESILSYLKETERLIKIVYKLNLYSTLKITKDSTDPLNIKLEAEVSNLITDYSVKTAFVQPELALNSDEFLTELKEDPELKNEYDRFFQAVIRDKKHTISKEKEELMAGLANFTDFNSIFDKLTDVEIKFDDIVTKAGEHLELNNSSYGLYLKSEDRDIRRQAHENLHKGYKDFNLTLSQNYISYLKKSDFVAKTYNHKSCFERALFNEEVNKTVYETLVKNVHKHLPDYQNYFKTKKKALKLKEFLISDVYASLGDGSSLTLPYDEAVQLVLDMVKVMGNEYLEVATQNFNSRWVDVFPAKGKQSGAFSISAETGNPFMMLNYNPTFNDISTIAHELGHSMHSYFSEKNQPPLKRDYVIFVAEVASTVNEVLLANKLMRECKSKEQKKFLAENLLNEFSSTVFRQTMFSEFEYFAHDQINKGVPLSFEELNEKYASLQREYFNDSVVFHSYAKYEWSRIPHFYRAFYVYKYATGFISAVSIAKQIEEMGEDYVKNNYLKFLSGGSSFDPITLLKLANVDIETSKPYELAFEYFDELTKIIEE